MKLLALDTSSLACTAGVLAGDKVFLRHEEREREHTRLLLPMLRAVLAEACIEPADLDAVVLGNGPGSFIGMRIAASVAEGIAFGAGLRIVPVSSLAAVAMQAGEAGDTVAVTQDAHMHEVYLGVYRLGADRRPQAVAPERLLAEAPVTELDAVPADRVIAAGAGWRRYPGLLAQNRSRIGRVSDVLYPRADALLALGARAFAEGGAIAPEDVVPTYLRQEVAKAPPTRGRNSPVI